MTLYDERVTTVSLDTLREIVELMDHPLCLCGGWAVYFTINAFFKEKKGREYLGSQDIDIGFYIPPMISKSELVSTPLFKTLDILKSNGFLSDGFRYRKDIKLDQRMNTRSTPETEMFALYVDILVNSYPPSMYDIYPNYFFEVPLIEEVYNNERNQISLSGISGNLFMPTRAILTAMKIRSLPSRGQEYHKKIKDLCDLYGLLWFSERSIQDNMKEVLSFTDTDSLERLKSSLDGRLTADCERYLGEPKGSMDTIIRLIDSYV